MSSTQVAAPPATQIDTASRFTQGVIVKDDDGTERVYVQNNDSAAWAIGDPITHDAGSMTAGKKALTTHDGKPEALLGFAAATIGSSAFGWLKRRGTFVCAIASGVSIQSNLSLTLRGAATNNIGLSSVPASSAPPQRAMAISVASIASNAVTASVAVSLP
ncbi:hypothetical protein [Glutamicibacter sp.]|jgi:hypothetical protein|uniref:hypothetical protein n=1 Tax=Glutamicibacter sp. TaxID=1931995 RepID=UPI002FD96B50